MEMEPNLTSKGPAGENTHISPPFLEDDNNENPSPDEENRGESPSPDEEKRDENPSPDEEFDSEELKISSPPLGGKAEMGKSYSFKIDPAIKEKLRNLPMKSGVYLFYDSSRRVIYVGKATYLKNRVSSYFQSRKNKPYKLQWLAYNIADIEYIITPDPLSALLLEENLIKKYRPFFNVRMKDDKRYPLIEVTTGEPIPRIRIVRKPGDKKSRYFGPYISPYAMRQTFQLVQKAFLIRTCKLNLPKTMPRPCLDYHINLCTAPCVGYVSDEEYREQVKRTCAFLEGRTGDILNYLRSEMDVHAENLEYEKCIHYRDLIKAIEVTTAKNETVGKPGEDMDFIGVTAQAEQGFVYILEARDGKLIGHKKFQLSVPLEDSADALLWQFIPKYYREGFFIPPEIYIPQWEKDNQDEIQYMEEYLGKIRGRKTSIIIPKKGDKKVLLDMAMENARNFCEITVKTSTARMEKNRAELTSLQQLLNLPAPPRRIEGYDISNISGKMAVASMVVFMDGEPYSSHYRVFNIQSKDEPDDFTMINEAITRRLKNLKAGELESFREVPDIILIDGGKGQLNAALSARDEMGMTSLNFISLAKEEEEVFVPHRSDSIIKGIENPGVRLLTRVRDESHRFALSHHRKQRKKGMELSILDGIPGIARKRKETLFKHLGSIEKIKNSTLYELENLPGFNRKIAEKILKYLQSGNGTDMGLDSKTRQ